VDADDAKLNVALTGEERLGEASEVETRVEKRFGVLPNFFRLTPENPEITANLWGFACFAYLDNPLPSPFKERLFVYLSRFCEVRYCIARHVGFLAGLGRASGDPQCPPQTTEEIVRLLRRPLPRAQELERCLSRLGQAQLRVLPDSGSDTEAAIFGLASHVFLQTPDASGCLDALRHALDESRFQYLMLFLAFVRTAHYWTKVHPELTLEDDIRRFLAAHEALAECVLADPEPVSDDVSNRLLDELASLRKLWNSFQRTQDEERHHIARELHDSVGQSLVGLGMVLGAAKKEAPGNGKLEEAARLTKTCTEEIRMLSHLLHPPLLEELGLASAVGWYVEGFATRSGITTRVEIAEPLGRLGKDIDLVLFRVLQESLTNVHRHSGSKSVAIRIGADSQQVWMEIEDQGKGSANDLVRPGVGITGMRERIENLGGEFGISSHESGTYVRVVLPLAPAPLPVRAGSPSSASV
jgi:signal transduction histidine kinase